MKVSIKWDTIKCYNCYREIVGEFNDFTNKVEYYCDNCDLKLEGIK